MKLKKRKQRERKRQRKNSKRIVSSPAPRKRLLFSSKGHRMSNILGDFPSSLMKLRPAGEDTESPGMLAPQAHSPSPWAVRTYCWGSQALIIWPWTRNLGGPFYFPLPQTLKILRPHSRPALLPSKILFLQGFFKDPLPTSGQGKGNSIAAAAASTQTVSTTGGICLSAELAPKCQPRLLAPEVMAWRIFPKKPEQGAGRAGWGGGRLPELLGGGGMTSAASRGRHRADSGLAARGSGKWGKLRKAKDG